MGHLNVVLLGQLGEDGLKTGFLRPLERDREAEPGGKAHELLPGVGLVDIVAGAVGQRLLDEVAAVGGGIDRDVPGPAAHAALQNGFQGGEIIVVGRKTQVINEENELERIGGQLVHQVRDLVELIFLDFHQAQALGGKLIADGLDGAGFAGARVAVEQHVVGRHPGQQSPGVGNHLFPLLFVAGQLGELLGVRILDRHQLTVLHGENMVLGKHAVALFAHLAHPLGICGGKVQLPRFPTGQESQLRPLALL